MSSFYNVDFSQSLKDFDDLTNDLSHFVSKNVDKSESFKKLIQSLHSLIPEDKNFHKVLKSIITQGFNEEQVWAQLELENEPFFTIFNQKLSEIEKTIKHQSLNQLKAKSCKSRIKNDIIYDDDEDNDEGNDEDDDEDDGGDNEVEEDIEKRDSYRDYNDSNNFLNKTNDVNLKKDSSDSFEKNLCSNIEQFNQSKSKFELKQEKNRKLIEKLEDQNVSEKPWQLLGEVTADKRPENSLLEEYFEYDFVSKPPPIITEDVTTSIESVIKQRIKDKIWDDVERKVKHDQKQFEYKKRIELDSSKNKLGLAKIYEEEYLKKQENAVTKEESKEEKEIKKLMKNLFTQLNSLSTF